MYSLMLLGTSTGILCSPPRYNAVHADHTLLRSDLNCSSSCAYLTLLNKSSSMVDGRLNAPFRCGPKLVGRLFLLRRPCLDVWKGPFEVEGKMKVSLVLALRDNVTDVSATVEVSKIHLRRCQPPILTANM